MTLEAAAAAGIVMNSPLQGRDSILATGGQGFIGQHVRRTLTHSETSVVSVDCKFPVSGGREQSYECGIRDVARINEIFASHKITGIFHPASLLRTA